MKRAAHHQSKIRPESREPEYQALRISGLSKSAAAERLGLSERMAERYEELRRGELHHSATTALGPMNHDAHVDALINSDPKRLEKGWRGFEWHGQGVAA